MNIGIKVKRPKPRAGVIARLRGAMCCGEPPSVGAAARAAPDHVADFLRSRVFRGAEIGDACVMSSGGNEQWWTLARESTVIALVRLSSPECAASISPVSSGTGRALAPVHSGYVSYQNLSYFFSKLSLPDGVGARAGALRAAAGVTSRLGTRAGECFMAAGHLSSPAAQPSDLPLSARDCALLEKHFLYYITVFVDPANDG